eukprot:CAMPEP_0172188750 /NCGR_PEP_ID=MMETSP1050-20130122/22126_1 /TAXON_ID=233186 /ORGANISM="Cryptomonas curvata, Strain CCAP979/52" /LENGTH=185 /DNA_ID=CAMNT_0012863337 /DNA_START=81 /DNA_END=638 /DNA_ORIENTATION=+
MMCFRVTRKPDSALGRGRGSRTHAYWPWAAAPGRRAPVASGPSPAALPRQQRGSAAAARQQRGRAAAAAWKRRGSSAAAPLHCNGTAAAAYQRCSAPAHQQRSSAIRPGGRGPPPALRRPSSPSPVASARGLRFSGVSDQERSAALLIRSSDGPASLLRAILDARDRPMNQCRCESRTISDAQTR